MKDYPELDVAPEAKNEERSVRNASAFVFGLSDKSIFLPISSLTPIPLANDAAVVQISLYDPNGTYRPRVHESIDIYEGRRKVWTGLVESVREIRYRTAATYLDILASSALAHGVNFDPGSSDEGG